MKRFIYVILDGAADLPIRELGNKTPLEAAEKPYLDALAKYSRLGVMSVVRHDIAPESDEAMLSLLGFDPFVYHTGRGPLEALGADVVKEIKDEVILRCNFAKEEHGFITDTEVVPGPAEIKKIARLLNKINKIGGVETKFVPTAGHRSVLILKGKNLSPKITNANPSYRMVEGFVTTALPKVNLRFVPCKPLEKTPAAAKTAQVLNAWLGAARKILCAHRIKCANLILARGAGNSFPDLKNFKTRWALLADMPVEKAIGKLCGMTVLKKPPFISGKNYNFGKLADIILKNFSRFDCFYIEIKGPDMYAHRNDPIGKKQIIEKIDHGFFKPLFSKLIENGAYVKICVAADHTTSCATKSHTSNPVPVMIYDSDTKGDNINKFGERYCAEGKLRFTSGTELFRLLNIK